MIGQTIRVEVPALVAVPCPRCGVELLLAPEEADDPDGYAIVCEPSRLRPGANVGACGKPFDEVLYQSWLNAATSPGGVGDGG